VRAEKTAVQPLGGGKHWPLFWVDPVGRCVVYANKAATNNWTTASKAFIGMDINTLDVDLTPEQACIKRHLRSARTHGTLKSVSPRQLGT
jgi:hypothetical protein